jgi:hypothetical protein
MLHFFNVCWRVEVICVEEDPIQLFSEFLSNSGLARTGYSHEDDCSRMVICHKYWSLASIAGSGESNILLNLCHAGPAYEHQKHSVQLFEFNVPTINVPEAGTSIDRIERLLGYHEQVKQFSTR